MRLHTTDRSLRQCESALIRHKSGLCRHKVSHKQIETTLICMQVDARMEKHTLKYKTTDVKFSTMTGLYSSSSW